MSAYDQLIELGERWKRLGYRETESGAKFFGPPSEPKKYDFLVCVFSPLSDDDIDELEGQLHVPLHEDLRRLFRRANGFSCFTHWFKLCGYRRVMRSANIEVMLDQPHNLVFENQINPKAQQENLLLISKYADGETVYIDQQGQCNAYSIDGALIFEWADLNEWVSTELLRFESYLNEDASCDIGMENIPPPTQWN